MKKTDSTVYGSFARLERKKTDERKLIILKAINAFFMVIAGLAVLLEFSVFFFEHWFLALSICAHLTLLTSNLCFMILYPSAQAEWLRLRLWATYLPLAAVTVITIV